MSPPPHAEFVARYHAGTLRVDIDRAGAARFVAARALLPLVLLPFFGVAVALALSGRWVWGAALFVAAVALRTLVRRSAQGYVLARALGDAAFYEQAVAAGLIALHGRADAPPA